MPKLVCSPVGMAFRSMTTPAVQVTVLVPPNTPCWVADAVEDAEIGAEKVSLSGTQTTPGYYIGGHPLRELMRVQHVLSAPSTHHFYLSPLACEVARTLGAKANVDYYPMVDYSFRPADFLSLRPLPLEYASQCSDSTGYAVFTCGSATLPGGIGESLASRLGVDHVKQLYAGSTPIYSTRDYLDLLANAELVLGFLDQSMVLAHLIGTPTRLLLDCSAAESQVIVELDQARPINDAVVRDFECGLDCARCPYESCILLQDSGIIEALTR